MSYDTTYVANFPPPADISRHSGLADRKRWQFLCRLRVFRAHIYNVHTAGKQLNNQHHNNNNIVPAAREGEEKNTVATVEASKTTLVVNEVGVGGAEESDVINEKLSMAGPSNREGKEDSSALREQDEDNALVKEEKDDDDNDGVVQTQSKGHDEEDEEVTASNVIKLGGRTSRWRGRRRRWRMISPMGRR